MCLRETLGQLHAMSQWEVLFGNPDHVGDVNKFFLVTGCALTAAAWVVRTVYRQANVGANLTGCVPRDNDEHVLCDSRAKLR